MIDEFIKQIEKRRDPNLSSNRSTDNEQIMFAKIRSTIHTLKGYDECLRSISISLEEVNQ